MFQTQAPMPASRAQELRGVVGGDPVIVGDCGQDPDDGLQQGPENVAHPRSWHQLDRLKHGVGPRLAQRPEPRSFEHPADRGS